MGVGDVIGRLLKKGVDPTVATQVLADASAGPAADLPDHVARAFELLAPRAGINKSQRKELQRMRRVWQDAMAAVAAPDRGRPGLR